MDQLSRGQRMALAIVALVLAVLFAINIIYWSGFAPAHPRVKHDILFVVLTLGSLLVAWFAWPGSSSENA
jgi:hypothetical protein